MSAHASFSPDWASRPGDTIKDAMAKRGLSSAAFRERTGLTADATERLLFGEFAITEELATRLADVLGATGQFWLSREVNYRRRLQESASAQVDPEFREFAQRLPMKAMRAFGWLDAFAGLADDFAALAFFEDAPGSWRQSALRTAEAVAFRTSFAHESNPAAVAAWLRQGARQAAALDCAPWNPKALEAAVPAIRALTRTKDPAKFFPKLVDICRGCGVAVVLVRTPTGCRASGATHFASPSKAVIQLSFRYRSDDHLWFTVFHEIAHLLLHRSSMLFVEGADYVATSEEDEANTFSARVLIPTSFDEELATSTKRFRDIMRLARRIGVSSGIVVGQMQNRGLLRRDQMNFLKTRYDASQIANLSP